MNGNCAHKKTLCLLCLLLAAAISIVAILTMQCSSTSGIQNDEVDYKLPINFTWTQSGCEYKLSGIISVCDNINGKRKIRVNVLAESPLKNGKQSYSNALDDEGYIHLSASSAELLDWY